MTITFAIEPLAKCWNEMIVLAADHWKETEGCRHGQPFSPSFDRYNTYDVAGWFLMFTARDGEKMVGYAGMYLTPSMHTQQTIATEDIFFLLPEYRKGRNALAFLKFVEAECKARGAVEICLLAELTNGVGKILEYMGYEMTSKQYTKNINGADSASIRSIGTEKYYA